MLFSSKLLLSTQLNNSPILQKGNCKNTNLKGIRVRSPKIFCRRASSSHNTSRRSEGVQVVIKSGNKMFGWFRSKTIAVGSSAFFQRNPLLLGKNLHTRTSPGQPVAGSGTISSKNVYRDPIRQVLISQSSDIFTNLALEDWLYRYHDFDHKSLLLLWRNEPCVVIGRHQNPWTEANVPYLRRSSSKLARRNSGGGTVYHDLGNVNCTFFTRKSGYDRRRNLNIVCAAIKSVSTCLDVSVNPRDDIVINGIHHDDSRKVSGTAAKLGGKSAYHHCTVLVDVNECLLHDALNSQAEGVESRATQSVRVPVTNLRRADPSINVEALQEALGWQFLRTDVDGLDVGMERAASGQRGFQLVCPDDHWFPGLDKLKQEFESHNWIFGKTPKFKVKKRFGVPSHVLKELAARNGVAAEGSHPPHVDIELEVVGGVINSVRVEQRTCMIEEGGSLESDLFATIQGEDFGPDLADAVLRRGNSDVPQNVGIFLANCVREMSTKFA